VINELLQQLRCSSSGDLQAITGLVNVIPIHFEKRSVFGDSLESLEEIGFK
jgi:hypothetical protein